MSDKLAKSMECLDQKAVDLESALNGKVDKSRFNQIEAFLKKLEQFSQFKDYVDDTISMLVQFKQDATSLLEEQSADLKSINGDIRKLDVRLSGTFTRKDAQVLAKQIQGLEQVCDSLTPRALYKEVT